MEKFPSIHEKNPMKKSQRFMTNGSNRFRAGDLLQEILASNFVHAILCMNRNFVQGNYVQGNFVHIKGDFVNGNFVHAI